MRVRLRPAPNEMEMMLLYPRPHVHTRWADHIIRVDETTRMAAQLLPHGGTVADLSCGDATIAHSLEASHGARLILGDYAPGYPIQGRIEETVFHVEHADLWVLSETLEHLDDPERVLGLIRERADRLVLSTPDGEPGGIKPNAEHIWSWSCHDVAEMLERTGWTAQLHKVLEHPAGGIYSFGLWGCS